MLKQSVKVGSHGSLHYESESNVLPVDCEVISITDSVVVLKVFDLERLTIAESYKGSVSFKGTDIVNRDFMCPFIAPMYSKKDPSLVALDANMPLVYRDRRMYPRYKYSVQVGVRVRATDDFIMVPCRDISEGGVSFYYDSYIEKQSQISIDLYNRFDKSRQQFDAIRVTEVKDDTSRWYGCQFRNKEPWITELIHSIVDELYLQEVI